jgi:hypothetical protein
MSPRLPIVLISARFITQSTNTKKEYIKIRHNVR